MKSHRLVVTTLLVLPMVACGANEKDDTGGAPLHASTTSGDVAQDAEIIFVGDFEASGDFVGKGGSYAQFDSNVDTCEFEGTCPMTNSLAIVTSPKRAGKRALQITLEQSDPDVSNHLRAEIRTGTKYPTELDVDYWYGWSIFVPKSWTDDEDQTVVHQWHTVRGEPGTSPIIGLRIVKGSWRITQEIADAGVEATIWPPPDDVDAGGAATVVRGGWTDWVMHIRWSPSPTSGHFAAWMNGEKLFGKPMQTMHSGAMLGPAEKMGLYGALPDGGPSERILYYDEVRVARGGNDGYALVAPK